jgi:hypothetical protein
MDRIPLPDIPDICPDCDEAQKDLRKERLKRSSLKSEFYQFYNCIDKEKRDSLYQDKFNVIHNNWAKRWKEYVDDPLISKPEFIDNSPLICKEHKKFISVFDLKDTNSDYVLVNPYIMKKLTEEFAINHEITITLNIHRDTIFHSTPDLCNECSQLQRVIRESQALNFQDTKLHIIEKQKLYTYAYINKNETWIGASHSTTVNELKLYICQALDIDPSEQQLSYNNTELEDDTKTLSYYKVTPYNPIYYKKKKFRLNSSQQSGGSQNISSHKETGFEGTILSGRSLQNSQKIEPIKSPSSDPQGWPRCKICTYINDEKSLTKICFVCEADNT